MWSRALRRWLAMLAVLMISGVAVGGAWAQAGRVLEVSGSVSARSASGAAATLKAGDGFDEGMVIETGTSGYVILVFPDGQIIVLSRQSGVRVVRYTFSSGRPESNRLELVLVRGTLRFVSGVIATQTPERVQLFAGQSRATIHKPGSADFIISVSPTPAEAGVVSVAAGQVSMSTPYGPVERTAAGEATRWAPGGNRAVQADASLPAGARAEVDAIRVIPLPVRGAALAAGVAAAGGTTAARLFDVEGTVVANLNGSSGPLKVNDAIASGTILNTSSAHHATIQFTDGQVVVLGPNAVAEVVRYSFSRSNPGSGEFEVVLLRGAMRYVGGIVASESPERIRVRAGDSTVRILEKGGIDITLTVLRAPAERGTLSVATGEVYLETPYGVIGRTAASEAARWEPTRAQPPMPPAALPAAEQAEIAAVRAVPLPPNIVERIANSLPPAGAGVDVITAIVPRPSATPPTGGGGCVGSPC